MRRKNIKLVFIVSMIICGLIFLSLSKADSMQDYGLTDESKIIYGFLEETGSQLAKKHHISPCGIGCGGIDQLSSLSLSFQRFGEPIRESEARAMIIDVMNDFLYAINHDSRLKPFLNEYPFMPKNIDLAIYTYDRKRQDTYDPYIGIVSIHKGEIGYFTFTPDQLSCKTEKYESFDRAIAILRNAGILQN